MTIANPKTPEAAQGLLAAMLEEPGALEKKPVAAPSIPEGDLLDFTDDEPAEEPVRNVVPPPLPAAPPPLPDIVVAQTAQMTGIQPPPVSQSLPRVLDVAMADGDLLEIQGDEPPNQEVKTETPGTPSEKPAEPDPVIEVKRETGSQPPSVDVPVTEHGGPGETPKREPPPDFSAMKQPCFKAAEMRRKHPDGTYVVDTDLLWKFLGHLDLILSNAREGGMRHLCLRSKKMAVAELFARGEAFRSLKGQQADQKRLIQLKDIEEIVGELLALAEKEPDEERQRWLRESFRPATSWVENQIDMDVKLRKKKELTTAGKTPHGATPVPKPAPVVAPPAPAPKSEPEPPTVVFDLPAAPDMTPPPQAVHTPPVAKHETPAKEAEKAKPPKNPPPEAPKKRINWWKYGNVMAVAIFVVMIGALVTMRFTGEKTGRTDERATQVVKRPAAAIKTVTSPVVTPVVTDECHTVKLTGVYGKPLTDKGRGHVPTWDCSKQGRFTRLSTDTGKVCGCTFKN